MIIIILGIIGSQIENPENSDIFDSSNARIHKMNELVVHQITKEDSISIKIINAGLMIDEKTPKGRLLGETFETRDPGKYTLTVTMKITNLSSKEYEDVPYDFEIIDFNGKHYSPEIPLSKLFSYNNEYSKGETFQTDVTYLVDPPATNYTMTITKSFGDRQTNIFLNDVKNLRPSLCQGNAACISGFVTKVVDGDTLDIRNVESNEDIRIRLSLVDTSEKGQDLYLTAKDFTTGFCAPDSYALFDEDDGQTDGSFGRKIGKVYCEGVLLNHQLLEHDLAKIDDRFCDVSEYSNEAWVQKFGCNS